MKCLRTLKNPKPKMESSKPQQENTPTWYWLDNESWKQASSSKTIEEEYQSHLKGTRLGQRVYHCFGDGNTALIDFDKMQTCCGSGRCLLSHSRKGLMDDHMSYKLKRE